MTAKTKVSATVSESASLSGSPCCDDPQNPPSSARRVGTSTTEAQREYPATIVSTGNTVAVRL